MTTRREGFHTPRWRTTPSTGQRAQEDGDQRGIPSRETASEEGRSSRDDPHRRARESEEQVEQIVEEGVYIISVAARLLSMHPQTLRKYERVGLVTPSRSMGMLRLYSEEDIAQLRLIKHLVDNLGLNLAGVELVLQLVNRLLKLRQEVQYVGTEDPDVLARLVISRLDGIFDLLHLVPADSAERQSEGRGGAY